MRGRTSNEQFRIQLENMVQTLRSEITGGHYQVGDFLPSEKMLASRFQFGNISVRKGLELLVEEGLIEKIPKVGNRVKSVHSRRVTLRLACIHVTWRNCDLQRLLDMFQQKYPWITVEVTEYPAGNALPKTDIFVIGELHFRQIVEKELLRYFKPLTPNEDVHPLLTKQFVHDGQLFFKPVVYSPIVLMYNKAHFRESGLAEPDGSWTWDDLIRAGEKLSEVEGRYGFCFHVPDINRWPMFLLQSGERFEWEGTRLKSIKGTGLLESIKLMKQLMQNKKLFPSFLSESNQDFVKPFLEGRLSMTLVSYMGLNLFVQSDVDLDIAPVPYIHEPCSLIISSAVGINAASPHMEEAGLFVDFLTGELGQKTIQQHTTSIPGLRSLSPTDAGSAVRRPARYGLYREMMFSLRTHMDLNLNSRELALVFRQLKQYFANMINEDELCEEIARVLSRE
ncbi:extracellular solute-binding protein [Paenibacillus oceani]|uniref:Extracellular solute-binding protein n=1 Tax=Paenibacillus oceani TaxID=2772510 RepID=A0A927H1Y8_9BACL|nr:extracellular solute-binding protein [Paenibacillus oceani]MBD2864707.1 extracellular solute-binding protein [Paenibacillus oceani]